MEKNRNAPRVGPRAISPLVAPALLALALALALALPGCQKRFGDPFKDMGDKLAAGQYQSLGDYYKKVNGFDPGIKGIVYDVDYRTTDAAMRRVQLEFRQAFPFVIEKNYGEGSSKDRIAVVQAMDQFALVAALKTGGKQDKVSNAELLKALKTINALGKIKITGAGRDFVQFTFESEPKNWSLAAAACAAVAPNIVKLGTGDMKTLEDEMRRINGAVLWWN
jgi:hypothetical protein